MGAKHTMLIVIIMLVYCAGCQNPVKSDSPPISISATDLWNAYNTDQYSANELYTGKVLAVTGKIFRTGDFMFAPCVVMVIDGSIEYEDIIFMFEKGTYEDEIIDLNDGDTVTVYGECSGTKSKGSVTVWESDIKVDYMCVWLSNCWFSE